MPELKIKPVSYTHLDFFNITAWRQTAAFICKYFHKGNGIVLKGRL